MSPSGGVRLDVQSRARGPSVASRCTGSAAKYQRAALDESTATVFTIVADVILRDSTPPIR